MDTQPRLALTNDLDTCKENDGGIRLLTVEEKEALHLLREVRDNGG